MRNEEWGIENSELRIIGAKIINDLRLYIHL